MLPLAHNRLSAQEDEHVFKRFIYKVGFLPFHDAWQIMVQACIVAIVFLIVTKIFFSEHFTLFDTLLFYAFQCVFAMDTIFACFHKFNSDLNKYSLETPRSLLLIVLDILSLVPIYEFYYIVFPETATEIRLIVIQKNYLRIIHLFVYLMHKQNSTPSGCLFLVVATHTIYSVLFALFSSVLWSELSCYPNCTQPDWSDALKYFKIDPSRNFDWFVVCYTTMLSLVHHNYSGFIVSTRGEEVIMLIFVMIFGAAMHIIVGYGHVTKVQLQIMGRRFDYMQMLTDLRWNLVDWKTPPDRKKKLIDFYTIIWKKRNGIVVAPDAVDLLPLSMRKEIFADIFWEALRHSKIFSLTDMGFKREIGLIMKSEFLLPGDYVMHTDKYDCRMIYIASGIIQLLSSEDNSSPLISFSEGTIFGEIRCFYRLKSKSFLVCASDCEIHTILLSDLSRIMAKYRSHSSFVRMIVRERVNNAKILNRKKTKLATIGKIKQNWNDIINFSKSKQKVLQLNNFRYDKYFNYNNMSLIVLSERVELQRSSICIKDTCPYVMEPASSFRKCIHYIHLIVVTIQCIIVPIIAIFEYQITTLYDLASIFFDDVYILDVYIQLITATKSNNIMITNNMGIFINTCKKPLFILDIFASIPFDSLAFISGQNVRVRYIAKIPKLLKVYKIMLFIIDIEKSLKYNYMAVLFMKYFFLYFILIYYVAAFLFMCFCFGRDCIDTSVKPDHPFGTGKYPIFYAFMYTIDMLLSRSICQRTPLTIAEMICYSILTFIGMYLYTFFLSELTACIIKINEHSYSFRDYLALLTNLLNNNNLPLSLRQAALNFYTAKSFKDKYVDMKPSTYNEQESVLLKRVIINRIIEQIQKIPIFDGYSKDICRAVANICSIRIIPPGTVICESGERSLHLYVIIRGYCEMECLMPGDKERKLIRNLKSGDSFPVIEALHSVDCLNTIVAHSTVELVCIDLFDTMSLLKTLPAGNKKLKLKSISPHGKFYIGWEVFRSIFSCLFMFVMVSRPLLLHMQSVTQSIGAVCYTVFLIDMFLRCTVQYYNSKGVWITDISSTAKYYINTSFVLDLSIFLSIFSYFNFYLPRYYYDYISLIVNTFIAAAALYRPIRGLIYMSATSKGVKHIFAKYAKFVLTIVITAGVVTNHIVFSNCIIEGVGFNCKKDDNFLKYSRFKNVSDRYKVFLISLHAAVERFWVVVGTSEYEMFSNMYNSILIIVLLWLLRVVTIALITGFAIGGQTAVFEYRNKIINFKAFVDKEAVSESHIQTFVDYFDYVWKRTDGVDVDDLLDLLTPKLQLEIRTHLYFSTLKISYFFEDLSSNACALFIKNFKVKHFKRDDIIIRNNDIQKTLYLVNKGEVCIKLVNLNMASLKKGAWFGCLQKNGPNRQTIKAIAHFHCELLAIDSNKFHCLIDKYPEIKRKVAFCLKTGSEYMADIREDQLDLQKSDLSSLNAVSVSSSKASKIFTQRYLGYINKIIMRNSKIYKTWSYILMVHLAPITAIGLFLLHFINFPRTIFHLYLVLTDIPFMFNVIMNFHLYYIDPESGKIITEPCMIFKRYLKSCSFWVDFLSMLPVSYLAWAFGANDYIVKYSTLSRLIRIGHLLNFYNACKRNMNLTLFLQWSYIFYLATCEITILALLWYGLSCIDGTCWIKIVRGTNIFYTISYDQLRNILQSFLYVINILTTTGTRSISPATYEQITISIVIAVFSSVTISLLCGAFTCLLVIISYTRNKYLSHAFRLTTYVQDRRLSKVLIKNISNYLTGLWRNRKGELMPVLLLEAPSYLREDIMYSMYGHHLLNSDLFRNTHVDFIRQLCVHLKAYLYLVGQVIAERGDVDGCMYFVHRGEVKEIDVFGIIEIKQAGSSFGEKQGVYNIPHTETYMAHTPVDALVLFGNDWMYLLDWFPASKEVVFNALAQFIRTSDYSPDISLFLN